MEFKLTAKSILITVIVIVAVAGFIVFKLKPFTHSSHTVDQAAVAACQKQVETTYTGLLDTASLVASATTPSIQKQEQAAKDSCVTSNTH